MVSVLKRNNSSFNGYTLIQLPAGEGNFRAESRSGRRALGCTTTAPGLGPGTLPRGGPGSSGYFLAMNVYLPLSSDSLSSQMTVHLPESVNFAFTAPFFVSYTAHTSSLLLDTDHS